MNKRNNNIEDVTLLGLAILKPAKRTQTSVWMAQHTTESTWWLRPVHTYKGTSLGYCVVFTVVHAWDLGAQSMSRNI